MKELEELYTEMRRRQEEATAVAVWTYLHSAAVLSNLFANSN